MDDIFENIGSKVTLSQKIERRIETAIRDKKLAVGSKLPTEHELCASFGVSRTALREALRRLNARGLISILKGSGMYVTELKIDDAIKTLNLYYDLQFDRHLIEQIIEVRKIFEPEIAKLAAKRRNNEDILELEKNLKEFKICNPDNTQLEADIDNKFHLLIAKSAHNPIIQISMEPIYTLLPRMRNLIYANVDGEKDITYDCHSRIFEAIKGQRESEAYQAMTDHLSRTTEVYYTHFYKE
jgi:GntR family transcriptional regulator, transcriptional repressor for pyruvate dehydrogenase complex